MNCVRMVSMQRGVYLPHAERCKHIKLFRVSSSEQFFGRQKGRCVVMVVPSNPSLNKTATADKRVKWDITNALPSERVEGCCLHCV